MPRRSVRSSGATSSVETSMPEVCRRCFLIQSSMDAGQPKLSRRHLEGCKKASRPDDGTTVSAISAIGTPTYGSASFSIARHQPERARSVPVPRGCPLHCVKPRYRTLSGRLALLYTLCLTRAAHVTITILPTEGIPGQDWCLGDGDMVRLKPAPTGPRFRQRRRDDGWADAPASG